MIEGNKLLPPIGLPKRPIPLRQPRHDLQRLVDAIKATVYELDGEVSITEAIGALEIAKLEILQAQGV